MAINIKKNALDATSTGHSSGVTVDNQKRRNQQYVSKKKNVSI